jgi:hypothetical protein
LATALAAAAPFVEELAADVNTWCHLIGDRASIREAVDEGA